MLLSSFLRRRRWSRPLAVMPGQVGWAGCLTGAALEGESRAERKDSGPQSSVPSCQRGLPSSRLWAPEPVSFLLPPLVSPGPWSIAGKPLTPWSL